MNQKYNVIYSSKFENDFQNIVEYIVNVLKNPIVAKSFVLEVEKSILEVRNNPRIYSKHISTIKRKREYYKVKVKNYILFFEINDNHIIFRRMLYCRRNFKNLI